MVLLLLMVLLVLFLLFLIEDTVILNHRMRASFFHTFPFEAMQKKPARPEINLIHAMLPEHRNHIKEKV